MKISPDEALDLLHKWATERTPLIVLLVLPDSDVAVKVSGFINGLTDDIMISDDTNNPRNHVIFPASLTQSCEYGEAKDQPIMPEYFSAKHGPANLRIALSNGASISFFEAPASQLKT
jgi:hypothetical protein